jgi:uncharacterized protein YyaL (SSP411 family)
MIELIYMVRFMYEKWMVCTYQQGYLNIGTGGRMDKLYHTKNENAEIQRLNSIDKSSLPPDGGTEFNRLIFSRSPYLLQHAENPVDWYPWGNEAFAKAAREDRPVFLSIGYATCHWCHVMERESFVDPEVAEILNRHFVAIKVDREERPDVDDQYMAAAQILQGGGGWPLNLFLTPERKPFYVTTYVPKYPRPGTTGFMELLEKIADVWKTQRDVVESSCESVIKDLSEGADPTPAPIPGSEILEGAFSQVNMIYDQTWGGFGTSPKFPRPIFISFLLRFWNRMKNPQALEMVVHSLRMMRGGGIYDQLGFGFHRYSVDRKWLVPHFEKMLYDQGMLAMAYIEAFQATGDVYFKNVAEEIFTYVRDEMTSPEGGFYSARDADTEGEEGKFYTWTTGEVKKVLGENEATKVLRLFGATEEGNFEGENIFHLQVPETEFSLGEGVPPEIFRDNLQTWRSRLLSARDERVKPLRDEKILTSWNGLMIAALARGFAVTGELKYLELADRAVKFIKEKLIEGSGRLLRSHYLGVSEVPAFLEDYAFFVLGLTELYEATMERQYLRDAVHYARETLRLFADEEVFGLFDTGEDAENVLVRKKSFLDGVIPSGNSVAAMNLLKIGRITGKKSLVREGEGILRSLMGNAMSQPAGCLYSVIAVDYLHGPYVDVTLVGNREDPDLRELRATIALRFIPHLVIHFREEGEEEGYKTLEGRPAAYVCHDGICRPPVSGREALDRVLDEIISA